MAPDLAVEVLSELNTPGETRVKTGEYFSAGVQLVWLVNPKSRTVTVHTAADDCVTLYEQDVLSGGSVLPGFTLPIRDLFAELDRHS